MDDEAARTRYAALMRSRARTQRQRTQPTSPISDGAIELLSEDAPQSSGLRGQVESRNTSPRQIGTPRPRRNRLSETKHSFHIVIMAYERPEDLLRLLRDIKSAGHGLRVRVSIHDDASACDMTAVRAFCDRQQWSLIKSKKRGGKEGFARRTYQALVAAKASASPTDLFILLQDDMRLCGGFFGLISRAWQDLPRHPAVLIPYHDPRMARQQWTGIAPTSEGGFLRLGWTDCSFCTDRSTLAMMLCEPPVVDPHVWKRRPNASSGLGVHLSHLLVRIGIPIYGMRTSLLAHVGRDSKMHPSERTRHPLLYSNFADGEAMHKAMVSRERVTASLASIPNRAKMLAKVIDALAPQVDQINVYLNGYHTVPSFLLAEKRTKIVIAKSQDHGDRGDAGKFFFYPETSGYVLTCDDDIAYPHNYVARMVRKVEAYGRRKIVSVHGATLHAGFESYFRGRTVHHCLRDVRSDIPVDVVGTGVAAMHSSTIKLSAKDFPTGFMADIHLAVAAKRARIGLVVIGHGRRWIREISPDNHDTLYQRYANRDGAQTRELKKVFS
jgi:hypothetical protein